MKFIVLFSFLLFWSPSALAVTVAHGEEAPDFTLKDIDGSTVSLAKHRGSIVIIIYWRTDQERSLMAIADGQSIFSRYKNRGVQLISVVAETENQKEVRKVVEELGMDFPVVLDSDRQVFGDYEIRVYPSTVIIDREFRLAYGIPGHSLTYRTTVEAYVRFMLGEIDEKNLREIISFHPETVDEAAVTAERRYNLALRFTEIELYDQAIEALKKSIEAKPDIVKSRVLLGFLLLENREGDRAFQEFSKAAELEPSSYDAKTGLGAALILKGDLDRAIEILNDAVSANPCPEMTYYELGRAYELKGENDKSIEMYRKAMEKITKGRVLPSSIR